MESLKRIRNPDTCQTRFTYRRLVTMNKDVGRLFPHEWPLNSPHAYLPQSSHFDFAFDAHFSGG